MKKEWQTPVMEVLEVNMTMANPGPVTSLDATYPDGTPFPDLTWQS
jgi:hypothetical protein